MDRVRKTNNIALYVHSMLTRDKSIVCGQGRWRNRLWTWEHRPLVSNL